MSRNGRLRAAFLLVVLLVAACDEGPRNPLRLAEGEDPPDRLRAWGMLSVTGDALVIHPDAIVYDLNTPLFSDYAQKLRTIWMPPEATARYRADGAFAFPVGTIVTKTFYYPVSDAPGVAEQSVLKTAPAGTGPDDHRLDLAANRLIESRILVRREDGWQAHVYIWNDEESVARREIVGEIIPLTMVMGDGERRNFQYIVPTTNQCAGCHVTEHASKKIRPIGLKARHLNKPVPAGQADANQLDYWRLRGFLEDLPRASAIPRNADWADTSQPVASRARAYIDINCAHCHSRTGPADTSGLFLTAAESNLRHLGKCKPPIAAGRGTGDRPYSIMPGVPERSILLYRMTTDDPGIMMPELGRNLVHAEGVDLVAEWIANLDGSC